MNLTDLERELRATLIEAGQQAQLIDDLGTRAVRPVLRRRTWLASGLAAASVAAIGIVFAVNASDSGNAGVAASPSPSLSITIPTSSWKPGDGAQQALRSGVLRATPEGCPYLTSPDPRTPSDERTALVWPAGYSARYAGDGKVELVAPNGSVVVREGDSLSVGGGTTPVSGQSCTSGTKEAFVIMQDLTR